MAGGELSDEHGAGGRDQVAAIERYLHEHIPLSRHLGTRVLAAAADAVRLSAPLAPNLNHRQTAFGGSLSALAILAGWTLVWVTLGRERFTGRIVIQSNTIDYVAPAETDFAAVCRAPAPERWERFRAALAERGRGRIELDVELTAGARRVADFRGRYVAILRR